MERLLREVRRQLRVASVFPNPESALMLTSARLKWTEETRWHERIYLNMQGLNKKRGKRGGRLEAETARAETEGARGRNDEMIYRR